MIDAENLQPGAEPDQSITPLERPQLRSGRTLRRDVLETVVLIVVVYTLVNLSTVRAIVYGPSMQPNFYTGQLVIVNRFAYYFSGPARGDVVILHSPLPNCRNAPSDDKDCELLIKRVIGLPGELVEITGGRVYINGTELQEPYIAEFCKTCDGKWQLQNNEYMVLGDNRGNSWDGHSFGPIPRELIEGQAWIRYWPPQDATIIPHPIYGVIAAQPPPATVTPTPTSVPKTTVTATPTGAAKKSADNLSMVRAIVYGPSMQPNFYTGQLLIVNGVAYSFSGPGRGDVVLLQSPLLGCRNAPSDDKNCVPLIKRVIGLPGELVEIKGGRVYINHTELDEPYVAEFCKSCDGIWLVKDNEYMVLGDNRNNSWDSHSFGPIPRDLIVGEAWIRYWPPQEAAFIPHPTYSVISTQSSPATVISTPSSKPE